MKFISELSSVCSRFSVQSRCQGSSPVGHYEFRSSKIELFLLRFVTYESVKVGLSLICPLKVQNSLEELLWKKPEKSVDEAVREQFENQIIWTDRKGETENWERPTKLGELRFAVRNTFSGLETFRLHSRILFRVWKGEPEFHIQDTGGASSVKILWLRLFSEDPLMKTLSENSLRL